MDSEYSADRDKDILCTEHLLDFWPWWLGWIGIHPGQTTTSNKGIIMSINSELLKADQCIQI
eukprot:scaffold647955_cov37-Prasinocladus_malaysianus.AAC.1